MFILFPYLSLQSNLFLSSYVSKRLLAKKFRSINGTLLKKPTPNFPSLKSKPNYSASNSSTSMLFRPGLLYPAILNRYQNLTRSLDITKTLMPLSLLSTSLTPLTFSIYQFSRLRATKWLYYWVHFTSLYGMFYETPQLQLYIRSASNLPKTFKHLINFRFKGAKLSLTLVDEKTRSTHFFLAPGLLLKYFGRRKSLKKTKTMKFLLMRFLRKVLILLRLRNIVLHFKGVPVLLESLLQMLYQPIAHPLKDPFRELKVIESVKQRYVLKISELIFTSPKPFGYLKPRKKGRIKRKIRRRVMRSTFVVDEM